MRFRRRSGNRPVRGRRRSFSRGRRRVSSRRRGGVRPMRVGFRM